MNGKGHLFFASLIFLPLWWVYQELKVPEALLMIYLTLLPDIDFKFGDHRNKWTHSILLPLLWIFWYGSSSTMYLRFAFLLTISLHLLCDLPFKFWWKCLRPNIFNGINIGKPHMHPGGFYCCFDSYGKSTGWYLLNGLVGIGISGLFFGGII